MSDVLHHARYTHTQQGVIGRRMQFLADINARAEALRAKPLFVQCAAPVVIWPSPEDLAFGPVVGAIKKAIRPLPTVQAVIKATAKHFKVSKIDILSQRRETYLVRSRQVAMYLCLTLTLRSMPFVGRAMGDRDHTTVLHGSRKIQGYILSGDHEIIDAVDKLTDEFSSTTF